MDDYHPMANVYYKDQMQEGKPIIYDTSGHDEKTGTNIVPPTTTNDFNFNPEMNAPAFLSKAGQFVATEEGFVNVNFANNPQVENGDIDDQNPFLEVKHYEPPPEPETLEDWIQSVSKNRERARPSRFNDGEKQIAYIKEAMEIEAEKRERKRQ